MKDMNRSAKKEQARLDALYQFDILDTEPEQDYNDIVGLAAELCVTPMALISFVDHDRQWFKASLGLGLSEISREVSLCAYAIQQSDILVVPDTLEDVRFSQNPLITLAPGIRFYAGVPLTTGDGHSLGTLCVLDNRPRMLRANQIAGLRALGRQVMKQLVFRQHVKELGRQKALLEDQSKQLHFTNRKLQQLEAEIQNNVDEISALKGNLESQESRYRELVENAEHIVRVERAGGTDSPVELDLDRYAEGDAEFKHKQSQLFLANIRELQESVRYAIQQRDNEHFRRIVHKNKMAIKLVIAPQFATAVQRIGALLEQNSTPLQEFQSAEKEFDQWCQRITKAVSSQNSEPN
jgi:GAF domain-containing protein